MNNRFEFIIHAPTKLGRVKDLSHTSTNQNQIWCGNGVQNLIIRIYKPKSEPKINKSRDYIYVFFLRDKTKFQMLISEYVFVFLYT